MLERIVAAFVGSSLGFLFGIVMFWIKEKNAEYSSLEAVRRTLIFLVRELSGKMEHDPVRFDYLSPNVLMNQMTIIVKSKDLNAALDEFSKLYTHWRAGNYSQNGLRSPNIVADKKILEELADSLKILDIRRSVALTKRSNRR